MTVLTIFFSAIQQFLLHLWRVRAISGKKMQSATWHILPCASVSTSSPIDTPPPSNAVAILALGSIHDHIYDRKTSVTRTKWGINSYKTAKILVNLQKMTIFAAAIKVVTCATFPTTHHHATYPTSSCAFLPPRLCPHQCAYGARSGRHQRNHAIQH